MMLKGKRGSILLGLNKPSKIKPQFLKPVDLSNHASKQKIKTSQKDEDFQVNPEMMNTKYTTNIIKDAINELKNDLQRNNLPRVSTQIRKKKL